MFDKNYWSERKQDLEDQFKALTTDTYQEIERLVAKKIQKQQEFSKKLNEINTKEEEAKKAEVKVEPTPEAVK
jgi:uncharacterized protein (DUF3084 family)